MPITEEKNKEYIDECTELYRQAVERNDLYTYVDTLRIILLKRSMYHLHTDRSKTADTIVKVTCHLCTLLDYLKRDDNESYLQCLANGSRLFGVPLSTNTIKKCVYRSHKNETNCTLQRYKQLIMHCYKHILTLSTALVGVNESHVS